MARLLCSLALCSLLSQSLGCTFENSTDFDGHDIGSVVVAGPVECCSSCTSSADKGCKFWTFIPPNSCWMKVSDAGRRHAGDPGVPGVIAHYTSGSIQGPAPPAPPAPPPFTCQDSWNCSLAGECKDGVCVCDKPWTGSDCSQLSFKPAPISSCGKACAYHAMDEKIPAGEDP